MKFMLLLWGDEGQWADMSEEEAAAEMARWEEYTNQLTAAGAMVSGEGLQPSATSKTLRIENGERIVTDGPFAETKEQLGASTSSSAIRSTTRSSGPPRCPARRRVPRRSGR